MKLPADPRSLRPMPSARAHAPGSRGIGHVLGASLLALLLHYFVTPAENPGLGHSALSMQISIVAGLALGGVVLLSNAGERYVTGLLIALCIGGVWILLPNLTASTWYAAFMTVIMWMAVVISSGLVSGPRKPMLLLALDLLLGFWVSIFVVQVALNMGLGILIDFHQLLHPYSEARISTGWDDGWLRLTGPHIEPGTYSNWVYGLVVLRGLARRKFFDLFNLIAILTTVLSFSFWAMLAAGVYAAAALAASLRGFTMMSVIRMLMLLVLLSAVLAIVASFGMHQIQEYVVDRLTFDDISGASKLAAWNGFLDELANVLVIGRPIEYDFCGGCESPQDAGVSINLVMLAGLVPTLALFALMGMMVFRRGGVFAVVAAIPLMFAKFYVYEPMFWLIAGVCLIQWLWEMPGRMMRKTPHRLVSG